MRKYFNSRDYCGGILIEIKLQKIYGEWRFKRFENYSRFVC